MDPRDQADALLSRARQRSGGVVTPDNMVSPMDASNTQQIPSSMVADIDEQTPDPDSTTVLPSSLIEQHVHHLAEPNPTQPLEQGAPSAGSAQVNEPQVRHEGLIPTTTTQTGRSSLQNRLEGL